MIRIFAIALIFFGFSVTGSKAITGNPFEINGVQIDAYGANVIAAREQAIKAGTLEAFNQLLDRLTLPGDRFNMEEILAIDAVMAEQFVSGIQIANERRSRSRYLGELSVTFDAPLVRSFLRSKQLPYVESQASSIPFIALWQDGEGVLHWQQQNPYARGFDLAGHQNYLVPFQLGKNSTSTITEDLDSLFATDPEDAMNADLRQARRLANLDTSVLTQIAQNMAANEIIIAIARDTGSGVVRIRARLVQWSDTGAESVRNLGSFEGNAPIDSRPAQRRGSALVIATRKIAMVLEDEWKRQAIVRTDSQQSVLITAQYNSLSQWRRLHDALGQVSLIEEARLDALNIDGALLMLTYRGSEEQLARRFAQLGIYLRQENIGLVASIR